MKDKQGKKKQIRKMFRERAKQGKELILKCDCGCKSQVMIENNFGDRDLMIHCRDDGRSGWHGVWLDTEKKQQVIDFLNDKQGKK
jgi:hypothetical protein